MRHLLHLLVAMSRWEQCYHRQSVPRIRNYPQAINRETRRHFINRMSHSSTTLDTCIHCLALLNVIFEPDCLQFFNIVCFLAGFIITGDYCIVFQELVTRRVFWKNLRSCVPFEILQIKNCCF